MTGVEFGRYQKLEKNITPAPPTQKKNFLVEGSAEFFFGTAVSHDFWNYKVYKFEMAALVFRVRVRLECYNLFMV